MALKLTNQVEDINYHFIDNIVSDSLFSRNLKTIKLNKSFTVTQAYEHRPDLIASKLFGSSDYDWIIMFINGVTINEIVNGLVLNYCDVSLLNKVMIE